MFLRMQTVVLFIFFFFNDTATTEIYPLPLHDALPIFHLEQQIADNIAAGLPPQEARCRAQQDFGGLDRVKEEVRDTRWETHLESLARDLRYALRKIGRAHV